MSTVAVSEVFNPAEPIPGYHVEERIGAGGYGEVWRAKAPGGIAKAIKIVYGHHDDERAARELSALNRIKEVRHPFLLSLERIEVVDGHLVIVVELATSSVKNLFEQYRESGLCGIPRQELLGYLHDAADALDYIGQEHSLQHLDIKPENLLLVGGRVKVADFGLVKDLQDVNSSIVSGLTPVYGSPELFDGRPSNHSDQYSLAIVYQEMLTGSLPYEGRTTAQLAAQHLHGRPRLDRLPASDQATIARALAKNPDERFPSCREMIDSLLGVTPNHRSPIMRVPTSPGSYCPPPSAPIATEVLSLERPQEGAADAEAQRISLTQPIEAVPVVRDLPPVEVDEEKSQFGPTIFIGIGGLGARTLQMLQRRLTDRFGDIRSVPALQMLLFDTDPETLKGVTDGDASESLGNDSAILLPLRQTADYRVDSNRLYWLSRRWIYNIPRSSLTQGFRPLGRLAFVDHVERVRDRIERAIKAAADPSGLEASAQRTGLPFRDAPPRVFVISSINGGTGSGMVLDVGYLVRQLLRDLGYRDDGLSGILAHASGRNSPTNDLAVANAYALLNELHQYIDSQYGYPGDTSCDLPACVRHAPFSQTYVVHLGEELESKDFAEAADKLSKYLYFNAVTSAAAFFNSCRALDQEHETLSAEPMVRTFGLCQVGFSDDDIPPAAAADLCRTLLTRWRGLDMGEAEDGPASMSDPTGLLATQFAAGLSQDDLQVQVALQIEAAGVNLDRLTAQLRTTAIEEMGTDPDSYLLAVVRELLNGHEAVRRGCALPPGDAILDSLDALIRVQGVPDPSRVCLESVLTPHLKKIAAVQGHALQSWILSLVGSPQYRVAGAQRAADCLAGHLRAMSHEAGQSIQASLGKLRMLRQALLGDKHGSRKWLRRRGFVWNRKLVMDSRLSQYFQASIEEMALGAVCRLAGLILAQVVAAGDKLRNLAADLNRLAEESQPPVATIEDSPNDSRAILCRIASDTIGEHKLELVAEMETALEEHLRRAANIDENDVRRRLSPALRRTVRATILRMFKKVALGEIQASDPEDRASQLFSLRDALQAAVPDLRSCGGARRLLFLAPRTLPTGQLVDQFAGTAGERPTVLTDTQDDVFVCYEAEQLPLRRVAAAVLDRRFQNVEVASRLHTRIDVNWSPL